MEIKRYYKYMYRYRRLRDYHLNTVNKYDNTRK
jgi:hypothetical protein